MHIIITMQVITQLVGWTENTFSPLGIWGLFILAFIESSFFPIPPDLLLIILCLNRPELSLLFAAICTAGSVLGGMFGYSIGYFSEEKILNRFIKESKMKKAHNFFEKYGPWAVLIAAFSPIPYKVFTISAGLFYLNFRKFIIASGIGRGARFFLVAVLVMFFGERIIEFIENYFNIITILTVIVVVAGYIAYRHIRKKQ